MIWKVLTAVFFVLALHFGFIAFTSKSSYANSRVPIDDDDDSPIFDDDPRPKFLIDTDAGSDDAVAILLALAAKDKIRLVGITCTYGNTYENNVETNVLKTLTTAERADVPVYVGAQMPLYRNFTPDDYFGKDGLGDFDFGKPVKGWVRHSKHAAVVMVEMAQRYKGKLHILTLGPLTNLGLAMSLDPNFIHNVARFHIMGGWFPEDPESPSHSEVEFNFGQDPEADEVVFKKLLAPKIPLTTLLPNNLVKKRAISKDWRTQVLGKLASPAIQFLNKAEYAVLESLGVWLSADAITTAIAIWPDLALSSYEARVTTVTCDAYVGTVVADRDSPNKNVRIIQDFNVTSYQQILLRHLA